MKTPSSNRNRRHTAMSMVLVWLFALTSGVVNACGLQNSATHGHAQVNQTDAVGSSAEPIGITAGHLGIVASHDGDSDPSKPLCLKAYNDGTHLLGAKAPTGPDLTDPGLAPFTAIIWIAFPSVDAALRRAVDVRPPPSGLPVRLLYSRLAL